jgi:hypothetical protein
MAYATGSLNLLIPKVGQGTDTGKLSQNVWLYVSADAVATVIGAGYVDDGDDKGMAVDDIVLVVDNNTPTIDTMINGT